MPKPAEGEWLDLTQANVKPANTVGSRLTIHRGFSAISSVEGADTIKTAALKQGLETHLATALSLMNVPGEPRAVYGIPTLEENPAYLPLTWDPEGELVSGYMKALLVLKQIRIPRRTRMVIYVEPAVHEKYGPCVKLRWDETSFVPINSRTDSDSKSDSESETDSKSKSESKAETKAESKAETKSESESESKAETKSEPKPQSKTESTAEPKAESKSEPKTESKAGA